MTVPVFIDIAAREVPVPDRRRVIRSLAALEARRSLRAPWLWLGIALSTALAHDTASADYPAGGYQGLAASFTGVAIALYVLGIVAGTRDRNTTGADALAPDAVLGPDDRALARLLGMVPAVLVATAYALLVFALTRVEGGFWVGDAPGRTDSATHGPFEVLQPVALAVAAAAAGVAVGRATARRTLACIVGALVAVVVGFTYWAWQGDGFVFVTLVQTQPLEVPITWPAGQVDFGAVPSDWLLSGPTAYQDHWAHVILDQRIAAAHDAYLLGLAAIAGGLAVRDRRGRLVAVVGLAVAVASVLAQASITPGA